MFATTNTTAKVAAIVAGLGLVAMSFASFAPAAKAAFTLAELQAMIAALGGTNASTAQLFTSDMTLGSTGPEVTSLQGWLIAKGFAIPAGATGYFGAQTASALAAYQASVGISPASGYFGPITRAKVNAMLGASGNTGTGTIPGSGNVSGGEASLEDFQSKNGEDDSVDEGGSAQVAEFEFDVEDADVKLNRIDVGFNESAGVGEEDKPWKTFDTVTLWNADGEEIASEDVSDKSDWLEDDPAPGEPYIFRFTGLNDILSEGDVAKVVVEVEAQSSVDGSSGGIDWSVEIPDDGVRAVDGAGLDQFIGDDGEEVTFDVQEAGGENDYALKTSNDDPDATTIEVEDNTNSDEMTVFKFTFESDEDSTEDLDIRDAAINLTVGNPTSGTTTTSHDYVINEVTVVIDGTEFDADALASDTDDAIADGAFDTASYVLDIDDGDVEVASGDAVEVEVRVRFNALDGSAYDENTTVEADVTSATWEVAGVDSDEDVADPSDTVGGEQHTLATSGLIVTGVSKSASRTFVADDAGEFDQGTFKIVFKVQAFGEDIFLDKTPVTEDNAAPYATTDVSYSITNPGNNSSTGVISATSGDYDEMTNSYKISEDDTATFTLEVTATAASDSSAQVILEALGYAFTDVDGTAVYVVPAEPEFQTDSITLLAA